MNPADPLAPCHTCGHEPHTKYPARSKVYSVDDLRAVMTAAGSHWWSLENFRFFRCLVNGAQPLFTMPDGKVAFISSEQFVGSDHHAEPRRYTVRLFDPAKWADVSDCISDLGGFQAFASLRHARKAIKAAGGVPFFYLNAPELLPVTR